MKSELLVQAKCVHWLGDVTDWLSGKHGGHLAFVHITFLLHPYKLTPHAYNCSPLAYKHTPMSYNRAPMAYIQAPPAYNPVTDFSHNK